jgi:hypothetical protein
VGGFAVGGLRYQGGGGRIGWGIGGPRQARFPGPHGLVHALAVADRAALPALEGVLAAIARRSLARMYGTIFFCDGDRGLLRALGVELPADLAAAGLAPVVGVYQPARADNLARLSA